MPGRRKIGLLVVLVSAAPLLLPAREVRTQGVSCLVSTLQGDVQGADRGASCAFLGIPYAAPPLGTLRWKSPQAATPWTVPLNATTSPANCPTVQLPAGTLSGSEDCLKLNIWVADPAPTEPAPVIVWLHTGAFFGASANFPSHNGQRLAEETGAIVVAPNYRLGPFGFLAHDALAAEDVKSGNYGLLDQRAALVWVRDNIARFGGDPRNVTLAGTSAGGDSVGLHLVSPGSRRLFQRAIVQSGTPTVRWPTHADAAAQGLAFANALGCAVPTMVLDCLRSKTRDQVLLALPQATQQVVEPAGRVYWTPVVDGRVIPDQPRTLLARGRFSRVPTIVGVNRDEGAGAFMTRSFPAGVSAAQYEAWVSTEFGAAAPEVLAAYPVTTFPTAADAMASVVGDVQFVCEAKRLARSISRSHTPAFLYSYEYEIDDLAPGRVIHGVESNILFGNNYLPPQFPNHLLTVTDLVLHGAMAGYWTRFAAEGDPNGDNDDEETEPVRWRRFKAAEGRHRQSEKYLILDAVIRRGAQLRQEQCDFWEPYFLRTVLGGVPASAR